MFYSNIVTRISNNGWVTESFNHTCPLSPYICIICAEILACLLRNDRNIQGIKVKDQEFLVSQYADDTLITFKYCGKTLKHHTII